MNYASYEGAYAGMRAMIMRKSLLFYITFKFRSLYRQATGAQRARLRPRDEFAAGLRKL
jgi:hypothetical protein